MTPKTTPPVSEHRFPCEQCGADLRFAPQQSAMVCDHCGHEELIEGAGHQAQIVKELNLQLGLQDDLAQSELEELRVSKCPNCAAEVEFDPDRHAAECPFCATPVVLDTGARRQIKPRAVLPFTLTEDAARDAMNTWLGRLWFAPNGLQAYARKGRRMQGVYAPYWTYDAQTRSRYSGERGTVYYETRTIVRNGKSTRQRVPKVRWRPASGRVERFFDDVLVLASNSLPKRYTDALKPWDLSGLEPYTPAFLAGFRAESYTVSLQDGFAEARAHMDRTIRRDVKFDIGGDRQRIHHVDTELSKTTFKHILLPIWVAAYKYRGRTFRFVVNGSTGRVQGERPFSAWKIAGAIVAGLLVAAFVGFMAAANG